MQQAYEAGKRGEPYPVPMKVTKDQAQDLYQKHFEIGETERNQMISRRIKVGVVSLAIILIIVSVGFYFYKKRSR
jgi:uncharacterized membrane protein YvbJ